MQLLLSVKFLSTKIMIIRIGSVLYKLDGKADPPETICINMHLENL